jgi:hypothetical protein
MVMLVIIFAAKKLPKSWCLGIDVFADYDEDNYKNNFGIGRSYPGLQLFREDGTIIPICWAASPKSIKQGQQERKLFLSVGERSKEDRHRSPAQYLPMTKDLLTTTPPTMTTMME